MPDYKIIETTYEVWTTIKKIHESDLHVFSSFSDPTGTFNGGPGLIGKMFTAYGFKDSDFPIMEAETTWDIDDKDKAIRGSEKYKYWLCLPIKEESKDD